MRPSPAGQAEQRAFQAEIRQAIRYERFLAVKALLALAVVAGIMTVHVLYFH